MTQLKSKNLLTHKMNTVTMRGKLFIALLGLVLFGFSANAQNVKIGYTNVDYILSLLPEAKELDSQYKEYEKQLSNQMQSKYQELETKANEFQKSAATMAEEARVERQQELQTMQSNLQKFQREAEGSLQKKQVQLFQPAYDKIQRTIDEVAKENGYTHVFSSDAGNGAPILLFAANDDDNISDKVLTKLGVEPPADDQQ